MAKPVSLSGAVAVRLMITEVNTTVIGPVGSEISVGVPPKKAATRPMITAPQSPGPGSPVAATPKASAIGRATTAAVRPPKASPLMFWVLMRFRSTEPLINRVGEC